jgi:hypothetical protein
MGVDKGKNFIDKCPKETAGANRFFLMQYLFSIVFQAVPLPQG